jgi:hypothetical protein
MLNFRPRTVRILLAVPLIALLAVAAGCARRMVPPCPVVRVDNATATLTKFRDGPGREISDVAYQAEILGFKGECDFSDESVDVIFNVDMALTGGPAAEAGTAPLYYFVAIPQFFPDASGKRVFQLNRRIPQAGARDRFTESNVRLTIPLKKDQAGAAFDVYVGFQLDAAQLDYNRSRAPR